MDGEQVRARRRVAGIDQRLERLEIVSGLAHIVSKSRLGPRRARAVHGDREAHIDSDGEREMESADESATRGRP
jgi:hypothetical protein